MLQLAACDRDQAGGTSECELLTLTDNQPETRAGFPSLKSPPESVKIGLEMEEPLPGSFYQWHHFHQHLGHKAAPENRALGAEPAIGWDRPRLFSDRSSVQAQLSVRETAED